MKTEMMTLIVVCAFTAMLWIPYVLNRILVRGLVQTVGYPPDPAPQAAWAQRLRMAHSNAIENLAIFAALVLASQLMAISNPITVLAVTLYFWSRVVHALAYTVGLPWVRTVAFAGGFAGQMMLVWQLLA